MSEKVTITGKQIISTLKLMRTMGSFLGGPQQYIARRAVRKVAKEVVGLGALDGVIGQVSAVASFIPGAGVVGKVLGIAGGLFGSSGPKYAISHLAPHDILFRLHEAESIRFFMIGPEAVRARYMQLYSQNLDIRVDKPAHLPTVIRGWRLAKLHKHTMKDQFLKFRSTFDHSWPPSGDEVVRSSVAKMFDSAFFDGFDANLRLYARSKYVATVRGKISECIRSMSGQNFPSAYFGFDDLGEHRGAYLYRSSGILYSFKALMKHLSEVFPYDEINNFGSSYLEARKVVATTGFSVYPLHMYANEVGDWFTKNIANNRLYGSLLKNMVQIEESRERARMKNVRALNRMMLDAKGINVNSFKWTPITPALLPRSAVRPATDAELEQVRILTDAKAESKEIVEIARKVVTLVRQQPELKDVTAQVQQLASVATYSTGKIGATDSPQVATQELARARSAMTRAVSLVTPASQKVKNFVSDIVTDPSKMVPIFIALLVMGGFAAFSEEGK